MIPPFRREFDAARDPSTARNTLGIIAPATWTPTLTFSTPGDLSVSYSFRAGYIVRIGSLEIAMFNIFTSAFTHTTAAGPLQITGLPRATRAVIDFPGYMAYFRGITKAGFTVFSPVLFGGVSTIQFYGCASGSAPSSVAAADMPSGGTVEIEAGVIYLT